MGLAAVNLPIVPTPSHLIDGHYPDGNDGTAGIPLIWAVIPDFTQKQVGTPFSVNLTSLYLSQPGDLSAVVTLKSGTLTGGWTLVAGVLAYDGIGTGSGTIQVRATRFGFTSDSNFFSFQSIPLIVNPDNQAPTIPTGLSLISKTVNSILVQCDAPSDLPTATIPASGLKEVRFFKNGVFDGVASITGGKSVLLSAADIGAGSGRRYAGGWYVAISPGARQKAGGLPNAGSPSNAGPIVFSSADGTTGTPLTVAATFRYNWNEIETSPNTFGGLNKITHDMAQCHAMGVMFFCIIIDRTFNGVNPAPSDLAGLSYTFTNPQGKLGYQMPRWNPTVLNRYNNLVKAIGAVCDNDAYFGGIGTQETSTGTPPASANYTLASYVAAIKTQGDYIAAACPKSRQLWFFNDIHGGGKKDLGGIVAYFQSQNYGVIIAGPDAVVGGSLTTNAYPIDTDYQAGIGNAANGTQGLTAAGPTAESFQNPEWTNQVPANNPTATIQQRYQYCVGASPYTTSPLKCQAIITDWGSDGAGNRYSEVVTLMHSDPTLITYTPPGSMVPGSLSQSGVDYNVSGAGTGIGASSDQWSVGRVQCNGDVTIIAKLAGITGADTSGAIAGLSIRETTDPASRAAHLVVTNSKIRSRYRGAPSAAITNVLDVAGQTWSSPKWLKLVRVGTLFSFFYSTDGLAWTACGTATIGMTNSVYAELFASSVTVATTVTAAFQQVNIQSLAGLTYNFTGLVTGVTYALSAVTRDQASNDSAFSATLSVATG